MDISTAQYATIEMAISIDATPADVWRALTDDIGQWWPDDFYAGGQVGKRGYELETEPGGRMYEHWDGGGGVLWGNVVSIDPMKSLQILGHQFPNFGGPSQWYGSWRLEGEGQSTTLHFSEAALGRVSPEGMHEKDKGWRFLWRTLKAHVEGTPKPAWGD